MGTTRPFKDVFVSVRSLMVVCKSWGSHKPIMFSLQNLPLENAPTFPSVSTVYPRFPHVFPANTRNYPCQGAVPNSLASTSLARWISFSGAMGNLLCAMVFLGIGGRQGWRKG